MDATRLKRVREQRGWSQAYVADLVGVTTRTVSRWEQGHALPYPTRGLNRFLSVRVVRRKRARTLVCGLVFCVSIVILASLFVGFFLLLTFQKGGTVAVSGGQLGGSPLYTIFSPAGALVPVDLTHLGTEDWMAWEGKSLLDRDQKATRDVYALFAADQTQIEAPDRAERLFSW